MKNYGNKPSSYFPIPQGKAFNEFEIEDLNDLEKASYNDLQESIG